MEPTPGKDVKPRIPSASSSSAAAAAVSAAKPTIVGNTVPRPSATTATTSTSSTGPAAQAGKPKMMFKPVVPVRKRTETAAVPEPTASIRTNDRTRGRGSRGGSGASFRGRGAASSARGGIAPMTASGVFSMGPSNIRSKKSMVRTGHSAGSMLEPGQAPVYKLPEDRKPNLEGEEEYSDQEQGVEIVDMGHLESLDVLAPKGLKRDPVRSSSRKEIKQHIKGKNRAPDTDRMDVSGDEADELVDEINLGQALDLSESEDEEEHSNVAGDFIGWDGQPVPPDQLYFFQFPRTFPTFLPLPLSDPSSADPLTTSTSPKKSSLETSAKDSLDVDMSEKKPSREAEVKEEKEEKERMPEGQVGTLLITKKGKVKMRLGDGFLYDINAGSHLDFLQQFVNIDLPSKRVTTLSSSAPTPRFIATPDMDELLRLLSEEGDASSGGPNGKSSNGKRGKPKGGLSKTEVETEEDGLMTFDAGSDSE
ncbi:DNA-directed RNA polymerase III subunit [Phaffia rhodozyma]|uniref:DNA-directed RNA polymerase III subunit n=1 Tax=Phaffia rhodozyma TaxID=264483 RepID=A0A0F7SHX5_PHARH|nr:DNA-directed RNA polymerase III subunit [Phaffia rhodozyma]